MKGLQGTVRTVSLLVLCYPAPDQHLFDDNFNKSQFKRIIDVCEDMNGIMVTTDTNPDGEGDQFRIDTRFGNTYRANIGNENCMVLWLVYDTYKANELETFKKNSNFGVHALFKSSDVANMNSTRSSLFYQPYWKYIAVDHKKNRIQMLWKEIFASPSVESITSTIKFKATGGGHCCAITAKIMGARIAKCFYKWINVGPPCRSPPIFGHSTECQFPYTIGFSNKSFISYSNASSDSLSEHEKQKLDEMYNKHEFMSLSNETANSAFEDSKKILVDHFKMKDFESKKLELQAAIEAKLKVDAVFVSAELKAEISAAYKEQFGTEKLEEKRKEIEEMCSKTFNSTINEKLIKEIREETKKTIDQARSLSSNNSESFDYLKSFDDTKYETHNITSIVNFPDSIQTKQLHHFCKGVEMMLNVTGEFTNNQETMEKIKEEKIKLGYPDPSVYDSCPFINPNN